MSDLYPRPVNTDLILVRHGTTEDNLTSRWTGWNDTPLNRVGLLQAEAVAGYIAAHYHPDILFASPLRRAHVTAEIIGQRVGLAIRILDGLKESHFGDVEGLPDAEVRERYAEVYAAASDLKDQEFAWPGGETRRNFVQRIRRAFGEIIDAGAGQCILMVGHGGMISNFLADLLEGDPSLWPKYMVNNCSVSHLTLSPDGPRLLLLNETIHLATGPAELLAQARATPPLWQMETKE
jgi:broad specificity phosphatase PhoE